MSDRNEELFHAGEVFADRFRIESVLGEGAMGIVYASRTLENNDAVALKVVRSSPLNDKQIRGRFKREAEVLGRIRGPNVCPLLAWGEGSTQNSKESKMYLSMPLIDGKTLAALLEANEPLSDERILAIAKDIARGLSSAHAVSVVHRDLKPSNVMLVSSGAIVVDFGLAKILNDDQPAVTQLTSGGMLFGTPEYMSPEQSRGDDVDARTDLYALGVILFEMIARRVPFHYPTPLKTLTAHMTEAPPDLRELVGDKVSPALSAVVAVALAKDPSDRYLSADEFEVALVLAGDHPDDPEKARMKRGASVRAQIALSETVQFPSKPPAQEQEPVPTTDTKPSLPAIPLSDERISRDRITPPPGGSGSISAPISARNSSRRPISETVHASPLAKREEEARRSSASFRRLLYWTLTVSLALILGLGSAWIRTHR